MNDQKHVIRYEWWRDLGHYFWCSCGWRSQPTLGLDGAEQEAFVHGVQSKSPAPRDAPVTHDQTTSTSDAA